jgi:hypothetical protein
MGVMQSDTQHGQNLRGIHIKPLLLAFTLGIIFSLIAWVVFVPRQGKESYKWLFRNTPRMIFVDVVSGKYGLAAGESRYWTISVDPQSMHRTHLIGSFKVSEGPEDEIQVVLAEQGEFNKWKNGRQANLLYFGDHMTGGSPDISLPAPGTYILAFRNTSPTANKEATADLKLRYLAPPIK